LAAWFNAAGPRQLAPRATRRLASLTFASLLSIAGCTGTVAGDGNSANAPNGPGSGGTPGTDPGGIGNPEDPVIPFEANTLYSALRKVKGLLVGLPPTDEEVQILVGSSNPADTFKTFIDGWVGAPDTGPLFKEKMVVFFKNVFQQQGFVPTEDFKPQLLENGGFDFGNRPNVGDDAFPRLVRNIEDSFAMTAAEIMASGQPFTNVLSTRTYMMTTALMSTYLQIEMPNDANRRLTQACTTDADCGGAPMKCVLGFGDNMNCRLGWSIDYSGTAIPIEDTLNPASPNYMVFDNQAPASGATTGGNGTDCRGVGPVSLGLTAPAPFDSYALLFQRLLGLTPAYDNADVEECNDQPSLPYFTTSDLTDWRMVTIRTKDAAEPYIKPWDLPALRGATELPLALPRVGFYTTPAYLALWNTNDSNQHRVTANQTLLVALGLSFTSEDTIVPVSEVGLSTEHTTTTGVCYGCHKGLDPLRQFWGTQFDFNDRNDFPPGRFNGDDGNERPSVTGGVLAFGNINTVGANMFELGPLLSQIVDTEVADQAVARFALSIAQKLCFFADSAACAESDPEFRRVAIAFQDSGYSYMTLIRELFSSPLVTGLAATETFNLRNVVVSVSRRTQMCQALATRLGVPDLCALNVPFPPRRFGGGQTDPLATARTMFRTAGSIPIDAFSRGSENLVTPSDPTLFYRAASELLCERASVLVVDVDGGLYTSSDVEGSMATMVQTLMGYTLSDPRFWDALAILREHNNEALASADSATDALRSTFSLACQAPTSIAFGL
jgi:hypothetical protein